MKTLVESNWREIEATQEVPEIEATQEAPQQTRLEDIQEATLEATQEMTVKGCTEEGVYHKGTRAAAAVFTE